MAADIANNVLYMVGLDGGLVPDDGDASSESLCNSGHLEFDFLTVAPIRQLSRDARSHIILFDVGRQEL